MQRVTRKVYTIVKKGGGAKPYWQQIGSAFDNRDGSINVVLNATPLDGRLHIRLVDQAKPEATSDAAP